MPQAKPASASHKATNASCCRAGGCSARIIAHGHFPLEVIAYPETHPWWLFARTSSRLPPHMQTLRRLLVHHGVSAYLNGHLHAAFGQRLHRLHRNAATGCKP